MLQHLVKEKYGDFILRLRYIHRLYYYVQLRLLCWPSTYVVCLCLPVQAIPVCSTVQLSKANKSAFEYNCKDLPRDFCSSEHNICGFIWICGCLSHSFGRSAAWNEWSCECLTIYNLPEPLQLKAIQYSNSTTNIRLLWDPRLYSPVSSSFCASPPHCSCRLLIQQGSSFWEDDGGWNARQGCTEQSDWRDQGASRLLAFTQIEKYRGWPKECRWRIQNYKDRGMATESFGWIAKSRKRLVLQESKWDTAGSVYWWEWYEERG